MPAATPGCRSWPRSRRSWWRRRSSRSSRPRPWGSAGQSSPGAGASIVEAGCGTGGNLDMLGQRGVVHAFEPFGEAVDIARDRHPTIEVRAGELPRRLPYADASFDLVAALDVLEHVDDDVGAMA